MAGFSEVDTLVGSVDGGGLHLVATGREEKTGVHAV